MTLRIKILLVLSLVSIITLAFFLFFDHKDTSEIANFPPNGNTVIAFGDSLVAGVGDKENGGFVGILSDTLDIDIINAGISGETSADGLKRIEKILSSNPDIVLLLFGGNDALKKIPIAETKETLAKIIETLQEKGAVIILLGVQGGVLGDPYEEMYAELAETYGTLYVPNVLEGLIDNADLMADRVHPNAAGYAIIAEKVKPKLGRLLEAVPASPI